jgi:outer membrane lipoprotein LolB
MKLRFACLCAALLLTACATPPITREASPGALAAQAQRAAAIGAWQRWGLTARLGLDDGESGGSGRLDWRVEETRSTLDFRGTLGRGAWRLDIDTSGATLQRGDGSTAHAPSVAELVAGETGLQLPVDALEWWVRGLPDPASDHQWQLDAQGLLVTLQQAGWNVHFKSYVEYEGWALPRRLEASDGRQRVSLAVGKWWHGDAVPDA